MAILLTLLLAPASLAVDYTTDDYDGADLALVDGDRLGGVLTNVGTLTVPDGAVVTTTSTAVEVYALAIQVDGTLSADGAGEPGGLGGTTDPAAGEAGGGLGGGGGGGPGPCMHGGGGGGGGYGGVGGVGGHLDGPEFGWGLAGAAHGTDEIVLQDPGSGGGGGGGACAWLGAVGGAGGGSLFLVADSVTVTGSITAHGADGLTVDDAEDDSGPGGGGSGGAIVIDTPILGGGGLLAADGGLGGEPGGPWAGGGGGGGGGRIVVSGDYGDLDYRASPGLQGRANHYEPDLWPLATRGEPGVIVVGVGGPAVTLTLGGACPGPVTIDATGFAAGSDYALLQALGVGDAPIPGGPCEGTPTGLAPVGLSILVRGRATIDGAVSLAPRLPRGACDTKLQVIDLATCRLSPVARF
ncbi:MAG: hypothetical protein ACI8PZ_000599 [Myxococcota bacterium]|jgi:hypothetical protein